MKKIALILVSGLSLFVGCATTGPRISLAQYPQIGILSCVAESAVQWQGEDTNRPGFLDMITTVKSNDNEKLDGRLSLLIGRADDLIEPAEASLRQSLAALAGTTVLTKEAVTGAAAYLGAPENKSLALIMLKPAGYRYIDKVDAKTAAALKSEIKLDAGIYAEFKFEMKMFTGLGKSGTMSAITYLRVTVVDSAGVRIFSQDYAKISKNRTAVVDGIFDATKLKALFLESTKEACSAFAAELNT